MKLIWTEITNYQSSGCSRCFAGYNRFGDDIAHVYKMKYRADERWQSVILKHPDPEARYKNGDRKITLEVCNEDNEILEFNTKNSAILAAEKLIKDDGTGV